MAIGGNTHDRRCVGDNHSTLFLSFKPKLSLEPSKGARERELGKLCMHVCARVCTHVRVCTCVCTCACMGMCVFVGAGHVYEVSAVPLETVPWRAEWALGRCQTDMSQLREG